MQEPVRLKLARQEGFSGGGFTGTFVPMAVNVKNIAFSKEVTVHYTADDTTWEDTPLAFLSSFGDYDRFKGEINEHANQFVIRYTVSGETYYDNNAGENYRFHLNHALVGGNVMLNIATARQGNQAGGGFVVTTSWVEGEILVANLSFAKEVGVRLSVDGGSSWHDTHGSFAGQTASHSIFIGPSAEVWTFKTPELNLDNTAPEFHFAVFYRDIATDTVFWDNNFGQNYTLSKANGATIE
jgi:hypothetical protein